ncbi:hypothetical protein AV521_03555 [Streptomyces sp. IMTB 2501]|nr:hypothetical protein AV521_03555 [Streptomyces sp. IMTB 2501]
MAQAVQSKAVARPQAPDSSELSPSEPLRYIHLAAEIERRVAGEVPTTVGTAEGQDQGADVAP